MKASDLLRPLQKRYARAAVRIAEKYYDLGNQTERIVAITLANDTILCVAMEVCGRPTYKAALSRKGRHAK